MKKVFFGILFLFLSMMFVPIIVNADISIDTEIEKVNVALDKDVEFYALDMETVLYQRPFVNAQDPLPANLITKNVNGYEYLRFDNSVYLSEEATGSGAEKLGWAVIDLGAEYMLSGIGLQLWNDWAFVDVVVQVSVDSDFSDAFTVFNNDSDNTLGFGTGTSGSYKDYYTDLQYVNFDTVMARYVRVTNNANNNGYSLFSRIEVYGGAVNLNPVESKEVAPVFPSVLSGSYGGHFTLELASAYDGAEIYYTTDGSYPTINSTLYTEPIKTESLGTDIIIRAIVSYNNQVSLPVNFTYQISNPDVGKNVAAGVVPVFKNREFTEEVGFSGFNGSPDDAGLVTDGSFNPAGSSISTEALAWAVLDFGKEYPIGKVIYSAWHDWWFSETVIELATNADFSDAITVFSFSGGMQNTPDTGSEYLLTTPVFARYLRVTNNAKGEGQTSIFTEIQAIVGEVGQVAPGANLVFNTQNIRAVGLDGTELTSRKQEANGANDGSLAAIVDGDISSWGAVELIDGEGNTVPGWIYLDFGFEHYINKINVSFWHDWSFCDIVIQLSTTADFSDGVITIFNNDSDNSLGLGLATVSLDPTKPHDWEYISNHGELGNTTEGNGMTFNFAPIKGRYLRVISAGNTSKSDYSVYTEIQAFASLPPVREMEAAIVLVEGIDQRIIVANGTTLETVYTMLPANLKITDSLGNKYYLSGNWLTEDFSDGSAGETRAGEYKFLFIPDNLSDNVIDAYNLFEIIVKVEKGADTSELEGAIASAQAVDTELYTLTSISVLEEKLTVAITVLEKNIRSQAEVDEATRDLLLAVESLVLRGDTTALALLYAEVVDLDEDTYTSSSFSAFREIRALAASALVEDGNRDLNQEQVDALTSTLEEVVSKLVIRATESEIAAIIALYEAKQAEYDDANARLYTVSSYKNFGYVLDLTVRYAEMSVDEKDLAQTKYESDALMLEKAVLIKRGNTDALKVAYQGYLQEYGINEDNTGYLVPTWAHYLDKMDKAAEVIYVDADDYTLDGNADLTQAEVDAVLAELEAAVADLAPRGDKTALRDLLDTVSDLSEDDYTSTTFKEFSEAFINAQAVESKDDGLTSEQEVIGALNELKSAYQALVRRGDKTELEAKIAELAIINPADYTASSYNSYKTVYDAARAVIDDVDAVQESIDQALANLTAEVAKLVTLGNKTDLYNIIDEAEKLVKADYTEESWKSFAETLAYAKSVAESNDVSQEDVEAAVTVLENAIDALQRVKKGCLSSLTVTNALSWLIFLPILFIIRKRRYQ